MTGVAIEPILESSAVINQPTYWVETRDSWRTGTWQIDPTLAPIGRMTWCMFHQDDGQLTLERKLGSAKEPWESSFSTREPTFYFGRPVRVRMLEYGADKPLTVWQGQIESAQMTIGGDSQIGNRQTFVCLGPRTILSRVRWHVAETEFGDTDWHPAFNRTISGSSGLRGNRSGQEFGGTDLWTHADMLEYLFNKISASGPIWLKSGEADFNTLAGLIANVGQRAVWSASDLLSEVLPSKYGFDAKFIPHEDGFYIHSVYYETSAFAYVIDPTETDIARVDIDFTSNRQFDKITVIGERTTLCESAPESSLYAWRGWTDAEQDAYRAPLTANAANTNLTRAKADTAREAPQHANVYASFVKPTGLYMTIKDPLTDPDVEVFFPRQTGERTTHNWIPLYAGVDYSTDPPTGLDSVDRNTLQQPFALVYNQLRDQYETPDMQNVSVQVNALKHDCGVRVASNPQHVMASGSWTKAELDADEPGYSWTANGVRGASQTDTQPVFNYKQSKITFAYPTDGRLKVSAELGDDEKKNDGSHFIEYIPDAQAWVIAPQTIISADGASDFIRSPDKFMIVRNDGPTLARYLDQLKRRYFATRIAAVVHYKNMKALAHLVGEQIEIQSESLREIEWPWVSSVMVDWDRGECKLMAGYAR